MTTQEDIGQVAAQSAELTQTVEAMAKDFEAMTEGRGFDGALSTPRRRALTPRRRALIPGKHALIPRKRVLTPRKTALTTRKRALTPRRRTLTTSETVADIQDDDTLMQQSAVT